MKNTFTNLMFYTAGILSWTGYLWIAGHFGLPSASLDSLCYEQYKTIYADAEARKEKKYLDLLISEYQRGYLNSAEDCRTGKVASSITFYDCLNNYRLSPSGMCKCVTPIVPEPSCPQVDNNQK
jgi:hypothetical protein